MKQYRDKYRDAVKRSVIIIIILALSVAIGFVYQSLTDKAERQKHPRKYEDIVTKYSSEYGVPEYVIYGVIKTESDFNSGAESSAGARGLMQIMPETFDWLVSVTQDGYEVGMLFDPETNIRYGTYFLSYLYLRYSDWKTVYAAYNAGFGNVDSWLEDSNHVDENGKLKNIPIEETDNYVKKVASAAETYRKLYYTAD